jgi:hypothetical protein
MIDNNELDLFKDKADIISETLGFDLSFDHFGIKTSTSNEYERVKNDFGKRYNEVFLNGRRISTLVGKEVVELIEPKPDEQISQMYIDHVSYMAGDYVKVRDSINEVVSEFSFGKSKGFKIKREGVLLEIRNNTLLESKGDL